MFVTDELLKPIAETLYNEFGQRSYNSVIKSIKIFEKEQTERFLDYLAKKESYTKNDNFK